MPDSKAPEKLAEKRPTLDQKECQYIVEILTSVEGNRKEAAKILGIAEKTLYDKIKKYQIRVKFYCPNFP